MTFNAIESSVQSASPVELYEIEYGPKRLLYTDQEDPYVHLSKTYLPMIPLKRTQFEESAELARNDITVTVPRNAPPAELFRIYPPSQEVSITISKIHRTDPDQEARALWTGRILNARWQGAFAELYCENLFASFRRRGLRRVYQRQCDHDLYGPSCRASKPAFRVIASLSAVDGVFVTAPQFDDISSNWFQGGFLEWERETDVWEKRWLRFHSGDTVEMLEPILGLAPGALVNVYPGCAHDKAACNTKFSNILNYGGFTDLPRKNPFNTTSGAF